jgi:hypothetical protein
MEPSDRLKRGLFLAPPLFVAHWVESPGFVTWFNARVMPEADHRPAVAGSSRNGMTVAASAGSLKMV